MRDMLSLRGTMAVSARPSFLRELFRSVFQTSCRVRNNLGMSCNHAPLPVPELPDIGEPALRPLKGRRPIYGISPHNHHDVVVAGDLLDLHLIEVMLDAAGAEQLEHSRLVVDDVERRVHYEIVAPE